MTFDFGKMGDCPHPSTLLEIAIRRTGLDDFGHPGRNAGLMPYVASVTEESWERMTPTARELAVEYLVHQLSVRLQLMRDRKSFPEISQQRIKAPLIVVGPPRSGSTLLHNLIGLDPDNMTPEHWLCREPSPPLALGSPTSARLQSAEKQMTDLFALIPDIFITHPYMIEEGTSGALAECGSDILSLTFTSQQLWCFWGGETYRQWLLEADHTAALGFHHDFLQHAQWGQSGKRWALKGSDHMLWMRELALQYPEAKLIWIHRDLSQQLGSLASVQSILRGMNGQPVTLDERRAQGRKAIDLQLAAVEKAIKSRDAVGEERFIDVSYHDVMADPLATIRRVYDQCGLTVSDKHESRIRGWLGSHAPTKHGVHKHSPEEFGMDGIEVNERFARYLDRFGFGFGIRPELTV